MSLPTRTLVVRMGDPTQHTPNRKSDTVAEMTKSHRTKPFAALATLFTLATIAIATAPAAKAAISDSEELIRFGSIGSAAGQLEVPSGLATDPVTGHLYVSGGNGRVDEFTPWGKFVKAFGWDVAPGAVNEQQEVRVRAAAGQFKLTFKGEETPDLAFNAPGSESEGSGSLEAALNALPSIGGVGGNVGVEAVVPGSPDGKIPVVYVVTFKGSLAGADVPQLTATNGSTAPSGGVPTTSLEVRTRADGTAGGAGLESCTEESGCKVGLVGAEAGEFGSASAGAAVDSAGNVYVREVTNHRVQKFDSAGRFLLAFGSEGTGSGQFSGFFTGGIALIPSGKLFVGDNERIQRFDLEGVYEASIPVPGEPVQNLAADPISGDLYVSIPKEKISKFDSTTGAEIGQRVGQGAIATDAAGNLFVSSLVQADGKRRVLEYDASGKPLSPPSCCEVPDSSTDIEKLGTNVAGGLYVAYRKTSGAAHETFITSFGPPPLMFEGPPRVAPTIGAQFATSVERVGAIVKADINPHFWSDARFFVQYGTGKCSEGGCEETRPVPPGALLNPQPVDRSVRTAGVFLEGLKPGTTYHYRFVAQSLGGGPVRGVGGEVGVDGEESTFTTYPAAAPPKADCPNQAFRTGFSAPLPDCRALEMVSPVDKNNGDIKALFDVTGFDLTLDQSSTDGDRFTYSSYRAFGDSEAAPLTIQYVADRTDGVGWASEAIAPPQGPAAVASGTLPVSIENQYKAFSADLCSGWLVMAAEAPMAPTGTEGHHNLYRRDNCGGEGYEALIRVEPTADPVHFVPELQGISADGDEAVFRVNDKLTPDAASDAQQAYYASEGELQLLCILPNGTPSGGNCSAGTGGFDTGALLASQASRFASVHNAISADGARVYWTASAELSGPGRVYLRLNPGEEQSALEGGECTEAGQACTVAVSQTVTSKASRFLGATPDGAKALFEVTEGVQIDNLYEFDLEAGESRLIGKEMLGVLATSKDLSHIYFASEEEIAGTTGATAGKPNLYLDQEGTKTFIATLSEGDVRMERTLSNTALEPIFHAARATPDGSRLAFISTEPLTGYDNTDQASGKAASEVYLYAVGAPAPLCVSCNPSGARPQGRVVGIQGNNGGKLTAASIRTPYYMLNSPRVLSGDGRRLFFDSYDGLLPRDTNGKADVYEWQAASGAKDCKEKGAELYVAASQGCLSLISSGESPSDSVFLDASPDGRDVFFATNSSLLPRDPGLIDVYDAREGGGLPAPPAPPGPCQGEACQSAPPPPNDPTPASASFKGAGNLKPKSRCSKGKVVRKGRCVARKRKQAKKHHNRKRAANHDRRASR
jgi:hypothetical protein